MGYYYKIAGAFLAGFVASKVITKDNLCSFKEAAKKYGDKITKNTPKKEKTA